MLGLGWRKFLGLGERALGWLKLQVREEEALGLEGRSARVGSSKLMDWEEELWG